MNDFYFGIAFRIVEVCRATRAENGWLIAVPEVRDRIMRQDEVKTGGASEVTEYASHASN